MLLNHSLAHFSGDMKCLSAIPAVIRQLFFKKCLLKYRESV